MQKLSYLYIVFLILFLTACSKEETTTLNAEIAPFNSNSKLIVDNYGTVRWSNGDHVWINGDTSNTVAYANNGQAIIHNVAVSETGYAAVYPAHIVQSRNGNTLDVCIDSIQTYHASGLMQIPIAAYTENNTLAFHNLTSLVIITVTNPSSTKSLYMKDIKVSSTNAALSGHGTISLGDSPSLTMANDGCKHITLSFANTDEIIAPDDSRSYFISLPPFSEKNLTITLRANIDTSNYRWGKTISSIAIESNLLIDGPAANSDFSATTFFGSGTSADPYQISNYNDLCIMEAKVRSNSSYRSAYYVVTQDIDCGNHTLSPIGGVENKHFQGYFNGDGHSITIRDIAASTINGETYLGLFGLVTGSGTISNLTLRGNISPNLSISDYAHIGVLCGQISNQSCRVDNCTNHVTVTLTTTGSSGTLLSIGGLCGTANCKITNCANYGNIDVNSTSITAAGGIVGYHNTGAQITLNRLENHGTINVTSSSTSRKTNYNYHNAMAGGLIGMWSSSSERDSIFNSYNVGSVSASNIDNMGEACVGGIVGYAGTIKSLIGNCYNQGAIAATQYEDAAHGAGIVGDWSDNVTTHTITICLNTAVPTITETKTSTVSNGYGIVASGAGSCIRCYYPSGTTAKGGNWSGSYLYTYPSTSPTCLNSWISSYGDGKYTQW